MQVRNLSVLSHREPNSDVFKNKDIWAPVPEGPEVVLAPGKATQGLTGSNSPTDCSPPSCSLLCLP